LGFRYSGWQPQPKQRTVAGMLNKTLKHILPERSFKILGAGRTDAKVSALQMAFELFLEDGPLTSLSDFESEMNANLPPDIKVLQVLATTKDFNIIQDSTIKEYVYLFSHGSKNHPFCAPFMANIMEPLDIAAMAAAASCFEGTHDFSCYTARLKGSTQVIRTIKRCELLENTVLTANFFPKKSYALYVEGKGFMRYQIRMIMGALIQLGRKEMDVGQIKASLKEGCPMVLPYVAPGSGLLLNKIVFEKG
jgi:tRNA pseudouridine38-40 synthase